MTCPQWSWRAALAAASAAALFIVVGCGGEPMQDTAKPGATNGGPAPKTSPDPAVNIKTEKSAPTPAPDAGKAEAAPEAKSETPADADKKDAEKKGDGDGGLQLEAPAIDSPTAKKKD